MFELLHFPYQNFLLKTDVSQRLHFNFNKHFFPAKCPSHHPLPSTDTNPEHCPTPRTGKVYVSWKAGPVKIPIPNRVPMVILIMESWIISSRNKAHLSILPGYNPCHPQASLLLVVKKPFYTHYIPDRWYRLSIYPWWWNITTMKYSNYLPMIL
jgi:hypothetical protein